MWTTVTTCHRLEIDGEAFPGGVEVLGAGTLLLSDRVGLFGKAGILCWCVESNLFHEHTIAEEGIPLC